jgi:hypothetical protein
VIDESGEYGGIGRGKKKYLEETFPIDNLSITYFT